MTQQNQTKKPDGKNPQTDAVPDEAMAALIADEEQQLSLKVSGLPDEDNGAEREEEELRAYQQAGDKEVDREDSKRLATEKGLYIGDDENRFPTSN